MPSSWAISAKLWRRGGLIPRRTGDKPTAVVLSADDYQRLQRSAAPFCLKWLLELPPAAPDRSRDAIDTDLTNSATGDGLSTAVMVTGNAAFQKVPGFAVALVQGGDPAAA